MKNYAAYLVGRHQHRVCLQEVEMTAINASKAQQIVGKACLAAILLILSGFFFFGDHLYIYSTARRLTLTAIPPIVFLGLTLFFYRNKNLCRYWEVSFAFFCGTFGLFLAWAPVFPARYMTTVQGFTFLKFTELLPIALAVIVPTWFVQRSLAPIYLQKGILKIGLALGLGVSLVIIAYYLLTSWSEINFEKLLRASGWMFLFALCDAFFELLMLFGLLLRRFIGLLGSVWGIILMTLVYGLFNLGVQQTPIGSIGYGALLFFLPFGFIYSFIMYKSDSIWGAICVHATIDFIYMIGMFASI